MKFQLLAAVASILALVSGAASAETDAAAVVANVSTFQVIVKNTVQGQPDFASSATLVATSNGDASFLVTGAKLFDNCPANADCKITVRQPDWEIEPVTATIVAVDKKTGITVLKTAKLDFAGKQLVTTDVGTNAVLSTCAYSNEISRKDCSAGASTGLQTITTASGAETTALMTTIGYEYGASGSPLVTADGKIAGIILGASPTNLATAVPASHLAKLIATAAKAK